MEWIGLCTRMSIPMAELVDRCKYSDVSVEQSVVTLCTAGNKQSELELILPAADTHFVAFDYTYKI